MKTIIHVNQHKIKSNRKTGAKEPVITTKNWRGTHYGTEVKIDGPCKIVYRPDNPLSCGAHVWIETNSEVIVLGEESCK